MTDVRPDGVRVLPSPRPEWFELECSMCGYTGRWFPGRGVVVHALLPNCRVQWDDDAGNEQVAA